MWTRRLASRPRQYCPGILVVAPTAATYRIAVCFGYGLVAEVEGKENRSRSVQKIDEEQITLNEVAGLYTVRASNYGATPTFDRLEDKRGAIYAEITIALGTTTLLDGCRS